MKIAAFALIGFSGLFFYAEHKRTEGEDNLATKAVEEVLSSQNRSLGKRMEENLARADVVATQASARWQKKAKLRSFFTDTALAEPGAPKWIVVGGQRIRAAGLLDNALLENALEAHMAQSKQLALFPVNGKYYLFVRGVAAGEPYASAYVPEEFFASLRAAEGIRDWLVLTDGTIIFHPLSRFIGSNAANLRPVAAGIQEINAGRASSFTARYLGLEARRALGAWSSLPKLGLLLASEWPKDPAAMAQSSWLYWLGLIMGAIALFLFGFSLRATAPAARAEEAFDFGRFDKEALEYIETVKTSADRAVGYARQREAEAERARDEKIASSARAKFLERKLQLLDRFEETILPRATGKQVWGELGALFADHCPGITCVTYRYSPSSFSLVPESVSTRSDLADSALAFLQDARIFIGSLSYLDSLKDTEAFTRWDHSRERHMPLLHADFRFYPFPSGGSGRGLLMVVFDRRTNAEGELEQAFELVGTLTRRLGSFCERIVPLVQSSYAKGSSGPSLASASNDARNQPRPS